MTAVWYGVYHGRQGNQVYDSWDQAREQCIGFKGARCKKTKTRPQAEAFTRTGLYIPLDGPRMVQKLPCPPHIKAYCDGSSLENGSEHSRAGIGVMFMHGHPLNLSERFNLPPNTNNRAELWAIKRAVDIIDENPRHFPGRPYPIVIFSDSSYSINCLTKW